MALISCPDCGRDVSDQAASCPHCGHPISIHQPAKPSEAKGLRRPVSAGMGCLIVVGAILVIGFIASLSDTTSTDRAAAPQTIDLTGTVSFTGAQFVITNSDVFDWTACKLDLNGGIVRSGYEYRAALLAAGETYRVGAMQFAKRDGERFNPIAMKPQSVFISCTTPRGTGYLSGEWQ